MSGYRLGLTLCCLGLMVWLGGGGVDPAASLTADASWSGWPLILTWGNSGTEQGGQFGAAVASGDFNGDGYPDLAIAAPKFSAGAYRSGAVFIYYGRVQGWPMTPDLVISVAQSGGRFGAAVAAADWNGDGYSDLLVGAPEFHNGETRSGAAFLYYGTAGGLPAEAGWQFIGVQSGALLGTSAANAGDVNGDGWLDLLVGAPGHSLAPDGDGAVFLFYGATGGPGGSPDWAAGGDQPLSLFGYATAGAGDLNGDGFADLVVGAPQYRLSGERVGAAFVYYGGAAGPGATADWTAVGYQVDGRLGQSVAAAGDVNGDGYGDLLIGADRVSGELEREGAAYLYHGRAGGLAGAPDWVVYGGQAWSGWGAAVIGAGDLDGDGYDDVMIGAPYYSDDQASEGGVFGFRGSPGGLLTQPAWAGWGNKAETEFGAGLTSVAADPYPLILAGAPAFRKERIIVGRRSSTGRLTPPTPTIYLPIIISDN